MTDLKEENAMKEVDKEEDSKEKNETPEKDATHTEKEDHTYLSMSMSCKKPRS